MNEKQWRSRLLAAGSLVKDSAVLPLKEASLAAQRTVIGIAGLPANSGVHSGQSRHASSTSEHSLPYISELTHGLRQRAQRKVQRDKSTHSIWRPPLCSMPLALCSS